MATKALILGRNSNMVVLDQLPDIEVTVCMGTKDLDEYPDKNFERKKEKRGFPYTVTKEVWIEVPEKTSDFYIGLRVESYFYYHSDGLGFFVEVDGVEIDGYVLPRWNHNLGEVFEDVIEGAPVGLSQVRKFMFWKEPSELSLVVWC
jgi:hypothetical protein